MQRPDTSARAGGDAAGARAKGLHRAVAGIEVRRTGAAWVAATLSLTGVVLLIGKQPPFQAYNSWSSTWADAARWLSVASLVLGPLVATTAAWVGGRESRGRLDELLVTTPRPAAQRLLATWASVAVGVLAGYLVYAAVVATAIAPAVSYAGGRWVGAWWLVGLGWLTCAAIGYAAGRLIPGRLVPPAIGIALYVGCGSLIYLNGAWTQLSPAARLPSAGGYRLIAWVVPVASVWLAALAATCLVLALCRRRVWAVLPAILAAAAAIPLSLVSSQSYAGASWIEPDPAATRPVCTTDGGPTVCVLAHHAGLLQAVTPVARQMLASTSELVALDRAAEADARHAAPPGTLPLPNLSGHFRAFREGLADSAQIRQLAALNLTVPHCRSVRANDAFYLNDAAQVAHAVAMSLVSGDPFAPFGDPAASAILHDRLVLDPSAARTWLGAYLDAARDCDVPALSRLGQ